MLPKIINFNAMSKTEVRDFITELESMVAAEEQIEIPVTNHFSKGVYAREIFIPKGSFIVGKIHRFENLNILSKGDMSILSIEGSARIKAPFTIVSPPGVKRVAYAHEDCIWTSIHGTNETDLEKIEEEFIVKTYDKLEEYNGLDSSRDGSLSGGSGNSGS